MPLTADQLRQDAKKYTQEADSYLRKKYPDIFPPGKDISNFGHNDFIDAFRHSYVSGRFAQDYGPAQSFIFGTYHELTHWNDGPERHMDFWNNSKGIEYSKYAKTPEELGDRIDKGIKDGELTTEPGKSPIHQLDYPVDAINNNEAQIIKMHREGKIDSGLFNDFTKWSSDALRNSANNLFGALTPQYNFDFSGFHSTPIGAFYDSRSLATDTAASIADKTLTLFDPNRKGLTAAQLSALDTNNDGQLSGNELNTLNAWADLNENGQVDTDEMRTLAQRGVVSIRVADFSFYTQGNSRLAGPVVGDPANTQARYTAALTPDSNYRKLRDTDTWFETRQGVLFWAPPDQIKINFKNQNYLIGTDGNDSFNAQYYAAYSQYFNINLLTHFLAGGGNDTVGGSARNDTIWGGTGNDMLWGYEGHDTLYGEDGDDQLSGDAGDDFLLGGSGADRMLGGTVSSRSNDAIEDEKRGLVYSARIQLKENTIQGGERTVLLSPGIAVTAEIKTDRRRVSAIY